MLEIIPPFLISDCNEKRKCERKIKEEKLKRRREIEARMEIAEEQLGIIRRRIRKHSGEQEDGGGRVSKILNKPRGLETMAKTMLGIGRKGEKMCRKSIWDCWRVLC